jgi:hypothetical protein
VVKSTYDDDFGKLEVELITASGQNIPKDSISSVMMAKSTKRLKRFQFLRQDGSQ